jgi:hypothetical protein
MEHCKVDLFKEQICFSFSSAQVVSCFITVIDFNVKMVSVLDIAVTSFDLPNILQLFKVWAQPCMKHILCALISYIFKVFESALAKGNGVI